MIELQGIAKRFGDYPALHDVILKVDKGEFVALLGPSGSGKTTLLRIIAGLEHQDRGIVRFNGDDVSDRSVAERHVGFVFQNYALFRHMTVLENIAFGMNVAKRKTRKPKAVIEAKARELLNLVRLADLGQRYPGQLSGGQRQRVALARALAIDPQLLLLDEPFGALDAQVRKELRRWLRELHNQVGLTSIFVTHDQEEALELADRVVVMSEGRIDQVGPPDEVYQRPATPFVSRFIGETNVLPGDGTERHVRPHEFEVEPNGPIDMLVQSSFRKGAVWRVEGTINDGRTLIEIDLPGDAPKPTFGERLGLRAVTSRTFTTVTAAPG